jgi:hypothetical protein
MTITAQKGRLLSLSVIQQGFIQGVLGVMGVTLGTKPSKPIYVRLP